MKPRRKPGASRRAAGKGRYGRGNSRSNARGSITARRKAQRGKQYYRWGENEGGGAAGGKDEGAGRGNDGKSQSAARRQEISEWKARMKKEGEEFDKQYGFEQFTEAPPREGFLINFLPTTMKRSGVDHELAAVDLYFLQKDGGTFKATIEHRPYFLVSILPQFVKDTMTFLERRFESSLSSIELVEMKDLDMLNHLSGKLANFVKLSFYDVSQLVAARSEILQAVRRYRDNATVYGDIVPDNLMETITDIREYDVLYLTRCCIDLDLRCGCWYTVEAIEQLGIRCERQKERIESAGPRVLAFDIECTKAPLKFPNAEVDQIFMISYMFDGEGFLIINREVVSEDIDDFEYTPKPEYPGPFVVFNEADERSLIRRFFDHVRDLRPNIFVTYNGDFFDWPFVKDRAFVHGFNMEKELGISERKGAAGGSEFRGRCSIHMDAFAWVQRDSYLPMGSRGLKAVTKYKLGYDPVEVDPEDMVRFASEEPQHMAAYSVSDAVATYYLYMKYVHNFIFSLCTIEPMGPEDVLRKGSGTLCENLLMVEAYEKGIVIPNKQVSEAIKFHTDGRLLTTETYVGGHVEALESGVFRDDLPTKFRLDALAFDELIANVDRDLTFALEVEGGIQRHEVENYDEIRADVIEKLEMLRDTPLREEEPVVYHLDVAAMYPNIILTNRLQPVAIVDDAVCAACDFNREENACKRRMEWTWRGDTLPASRAEYNAIRIQVEHELANKVSQMSTEGDDGNQGRDQGGNNRPENPNATKNAVVKARLKDYCQKVYKKTKVTTTEERVSTICQRENPFYVDTVRAFRDRRYEYKKATKKWAKEQSKQARAGDKIAQAEAKNKMVLYDSLQLAHKCILNSFYGYVMRRGARWYSMPMAAVVTKTGAPTGRLLMIILHWRPLSFTISAPRNSPSLFATVIAVDFPSPYSLRVFDMDRFSEMRFRSSSSSIFFPLVKSTSSHWSAIFATES